MKISLLTIGLVLSLLFILEIESKPNRISFRIQEKQELLLQQKENAKGKGKILSPQQSQEFQPNQLQLNYLRQKVNETYPNIKEEDQNDFLRVLYQHSKVMENVTQQHHELLKASKKSNLFNCTLLRSSVENPTNVNKLLPGDIRVVGAMGDSLTAAFGALATSYFSMFTEYRGVSWSAGGDSDVEGGVITVPNLLKAYNAKIKGFSLATGKQDSPNAHFNRAITGSRAPDMIGQARTLVQKLKESKEVNINEDWKMITMWVGSNDLCDVCNDRVGMYSPEAYESNLRKAIQIIRDDIPRVFINLIQGINPTELYDIKSGWCEWLHSYECPCGSSADKKVRDFVTERLREYNQRLINIANDTKFIADDFAVVIQPFLSYTNIPKDSAGNPDMKYFALDCFHFSGLAHQAAAIGLWNNLFQKVNHKTLHFTPGDDIICPNENQYLATVANSI